MEMISSPKEKKKQNKPTVTLEQLLVASNIFALMHSTYILYKLIKLAIQYDTPAMTVFREWAALSLLPTLTAVQSLMLL